MKLNQSPVIQSSLPRQHRHRRHLVTSGFSEMEATCNARPPKKFCLNKSEGPSAELLEVETEIQLIEVILIQLI